MPLLSPSLSHTLPPTLLFISSSQTVRSFFRKNMETCVGWLSVVRNFIVPVAIHAGMPAVAARHGFAALKTLAKHQHVSHNSHVSIHLSCMYNVHVQWMHVQYAHACLYSTYCMYNSYVTGVCFLCVLCMCMLCVCVLNACVLCVCIECVFGVCVVCANAYLPVD